MFVCLFVYITSYSCNLVIYFYYILCRFVNNKTKNNACHEVIADFDREVFTQKTPVKRKKAKKSSASILVKNITYLSTINTLIV